ncbi:glutamate racemase [Pleomorphomonas diazotrophica]|nr:glutamate racemase [Pleomorphomonas diazotrophica]SFM47180.1 glutamate racemase [Pleomorphomonas diazotrophica]
MRILVFDSGVGGLSVAREIGKALPDAGMDYVADLAVFPYGALEPDVLIERVVSLMDEAFAVLDPAALVIACNTASTLVLPPLRARFKLPIVGTVPAVKPAAEHSRSRLASVLATPGTVKRDYTHDLIETFGGDCRFTLVGSGALAGLVERQFSGEAVTDTELFAEIAPCFVEEEGRRTDTVVLACTHYPLVLDRLKALAPWPVEWIDPAPAIARRVATVTAGAGPSRDEGLPLRFFSTGRRPARAMLDAFGFVEGTGLFSAAAEKSADLGSKAGKAALSV